MKKHGFIKGAGLLAAASLGVKIIGAFYRIPLTNILGAEGMGVYQLVFPVFSFLLSMSSGALPLAISMLVSRGDEENNRLTLTSAFAALMLTGLIGTIALAALSPVIARIQGNEKAAWGFVAIAPSVLLVAGISVFRGWFQGYQNMTPSALSQLVEGVVKLTTGLLFAYLLLPLGLSAAVAGALAGTSLSELATLIMLYALYRKGNPKLQLKIPIREAKKRYKEILRITFPITLGGMILPLTQMADSFLVVNILSKSMPVEVATAGYGVWTGPVGSLLNLPVALALSLGVAVVPQMAKGLADRDWRAIKTKADTAIKIAFAIGVPFGALFFAAPEPIIRVLYPALTAEQIALGGKLLRISAINVVSLTLMQIFTSILQGLGETYRPVKHLAIGGAIKVVLDVILLLTVGLEGVAYSSMAAFAVTAVLNGISLTRLAGNSATLWKNSSAIALGGVIMGSVIYLLRPTHPTGFVWAAVLTAGAVAYFVCLLTSDVFYREEWLALPLGKFWYHLNRRFSWRNKR